MTTAAGSFAAFYATTWPELARYGTSLAGDVGADLAQEACVRVYARWPLLREPRAYAFRTVTNLVHDRWRRAGSEQRALQLLDAGAAGPADRDHGLLDAVRRLPEVQREVVLLHYYADLPVAEIARVLRRPAGTVKSRLHDARATLARTLADPLEVPRD